MFLKNNDEIISKHKLELDKKIIKKNTCKGSPERYSTNNSAK